MSDKQDTKVREPKTLPPITNDLLQQAQSELPATAGWSYPNWELAKTEMELAAIAETHGHNRIIARVVIEHLKAAIKALSPDSSNS